MRCESVLIVEDNEDIRASVEEILNYEGYRTYSVANGKEALLALKKISGPCLILLDLMMPGMSGWEFLEIQSKTEIDSDSSKTPVVVISALKASDALSYKNKPVPAVGYINKPIGLETLLAMVEQHCNKKLVLPHAPKVRPLPALHDAVSLKKLQCEIH